MKDIRLAEKLSQVSKDFTKMTSLSKAEAILAFLLKELDKPISEHTMCKLNEIAYLEDSLNRYYENKDCRIAVMLLKYFVEFGNFDLLPANDDKSDYKEQFVRVKQVLIGMVL